MRPPDRQHETNSCPTHSCAKWSHSSICCVTKPLVVSSWMTNTPSNTPHRQKATVRDVHWGLSSLVSPFHTCSRRCGPSWTPEPLPDASTLTREMTAKAREHAPHLTLTTATVFCIHPTSCHFFKLWRNTANPLVSTSTVPKPRLSLPSPASP